MTTDLTHIYEHGFCKITSNQELDVAKLDDIVVEFMQSGLYSASIREKNNLHYVVALRKPNNERNNNG